MPIAGLDSIIESILKEAKEKANALLNSFLAEKEKIFNEANFQAVKIMESKFSSVFDETKSLKTRAESLAAMKLRDGILKVKFSIIDEVIKLAKKAISELPDDEYFSLILNICSRHFIKGKTAKLMLSRKDIGRLSVENEDRFINEAGTKGLKLKVVGSRGGKGFSGAIIKYEDFEENCTFDVIFEENRDKIVNFLMDFLFSDEKVIAFLDDVNSGKDGLVFSSNSETSDFDSSNERDVISSKISQTVGGEVPPDFDENSRSNVGSLSTDEQPQVSLPSFEEDVSPSSLPSVEAQYPSDSVSGEDQSKVVSLCAGGQLPDSSLSESDPSTRPLSSDGQISVDSFAEEVQPENSSIRAENQHPDSALFKDSKDDLEKFLSTVSIGDLENLIPKSLPKEEFAKLFEETFGSGKSGKEDFLDVAKNMNIKDIEKFESQRKRYLDPALLRDIEQRVRTVNAENMALGSSIKTEKDKSAGK